MCLANARSGYVFCLGVFLIYLFGFHLIFWISFRFDTTRLRPRDLKKNDCSTGELSLIVPLSGKGADARGFVCTEPYARLCVHSSLLHPDKQFSDFEGGTWRRSLNCLSNHRKGYFIDIDGKVPLTTIVCQTKTQQPSYILRNSSVTFPICGSKTRAFVSPTPSNKEQRALITICAGCLSAFHISPRCKRAAPVRNLVYGSSFHNAASPRTPPFAAPLPALSSRTRALFLECFLLFLEHSTHPRP